MRLVLALPFDQRNPVPDFYSRGAMRRMVETIEEAGFDACSVTDHPYPTASWLESGGHHSLDPLVALACAGTASSTVKLLTNCFIAAYRNPYVSAKAIATLDSFTDGRVILGVAVGYLEGEFEALGVPFRRRGQLLDEAIAQMKAAWTGGESATGNVMLPRPTSSPHPPIWIGGNSSAAVRRAVSVGDGWIPFPAPTQMAEAIRTKPLRSHDDLASMIEEARALEKTAGRDRALDICFTPFSHPHWRENCDPTALVDEASILRAIGVTWMSFHLPAPTVEEFCANVWLIGREAIPAIRALDG